jgi:hypothetical protein
MMTHLWVHIGIRKWQQGICRGARRRGHGVEVSVSAAHLGWWKVSKYCTARIRKFQPYTVRSCLLGFFADGGEF